MAVFKVSLKQWVKVGLSEVSYAKILEAGNRPIWKGTSFTLFDESTNTEYGKAKVVGSVLHPDMAFRLRFKLLVGEPMMAHMSVSPGGEIFMVGEEDGPGLIPGAAVSPGSGGKVKAAAPTPKPSDGSPPILADADHVGQFVQGTNNPYRVMLLSKDGNIAYRYTGTGLSLRVEGMTPSTRKAVEEWGLKVKTSPRLYASGHLSVTNKSAALRTIGSLCAMILTDSPIAMLGKDKF
jgi:hypothetical protein